MNAPTPDDAGYTRPVESPTVRVPGHGPDETTQVGLPADFGNWQTYPAYELPPEPRPRAGNGSARWLSTALAVVLVLGTLTAVGVLAARHPVRQLAGEPTARTPGTSSSRTPSASASRSPSAAPTSTEQPSASGAPGSGPAAHPLSTAQATMPPLACALPRFDPADDRQASFFQAAKACADAAWQPVLSSAGVAQPDIALVVVVASASTTPCGAIAPSAPATHCAGIVYMTPAHLRDVEGLGRYPGKYFGVFLREYAGALQDATGLTTSAGTTPDAATRLAQQATCMAGMTSGAMADQGAVDANITGEIRARLTSTDAPPAADVWLEHGYQSRQLSACNSWV